MSAGFKIGKLINSKMSWSLSVGHDIEYDLEEVQDSILEGNIAVSKEIIDIYGKNFIDVAEAVQESRDTEALVALADVLSSPKKAISAWVILANKFDKEKTGHIGKFTLETLSGVLSQASYGLLKMALQAHGIHLP
jgi:hypothetical protein